MATNCSVIIKDDTFNIVLYHHCDGFVEVVGKSIYDFLKSLTDNNIKWDVHDIATQMVKGNIQTPSNYSDLSYEFVKDIAEDSAFIYEIDCKENTFTMWEVPNDRFATDKFKEYSHITTF